MQIELSVGVARSLKTICRSSPEGITCLSKRATRHAKASLGGLPSRPAVTVRNSRCRWSDSRHLERGGLTPVCPATAFGDESGNHYYSRSEGFSMVSKWRMSPFSYNLKWKSRQVPNTSLIHEQSIYYPGVANLEHGFRLLTF